MRTAALALAAAVLLAGCGGASHTVPVDYAPLEEIRERPRWLGSDALITTIGNTAYVADLPEWLERHPPGSVSYRAKLLHEQIHAQRQTAAGLTAWLARYGTATDFMWSEEQRGWYKELRELHQWGQTVNPEGVARILADYKNLTGNMVSYADALQWVQAVLNGGWTPPPD